MFRVFKEFVKQDLDEGTKMRILSSQWIAPSTHIAVLNISLIPKNS
jgi:hypothetical protein